MVGPVRYCPACYAVNPLGATACERCGAALVTEESFEERLIWALRHPDTQTAILAADILGQRRARRAIPALLEVAESSEPYRAAAAVRALGAFADDGGVATRLRRLARAPSIIVRRAAEAALAASGSSPEDEPVGPLPDAAGSAGQLPKPASGRRAGTAGGER